MLRNRPLLANLPSLHLTVFLVSVLGFYYIGLIAGVALIDIDSDFSEEFLVSFPHGFTTDILTALIWAHLRWFLCGLVILLLPCSGIILHLLIFFRGLFLAMGLIPFLRDAVLPVLLLRTGLVALLECSVLAVLFTLAAFRWYVSFSRSGMGSVLPDGLFYSLYIGLSVVSSLVCAIAQLWLLPGFACYIQLST